MAIDMPNNPTVGDTFVASNGVNYEWDGTKWEVQSDAASGVNLWARNSIDNSIEPIYADDKVVVNTASSTTITMDPALGIRLASTVNFNGNIDVENLPALP